LVTVIVAVKRRDSTLRRRPNARTREDYLQLVEERDQLDIARVHGLLERLDHELLPCRGIGEPAHPWFQFFHPLLETAGFIRAACGGDRRAVQPFSRCIPLDTSGYGLIKPACRKCVRLAPAPSPAS
jgi:hypothetical protein